MIISLFNYYIVSKFEKCKNEQMALLDLSTLRSPEENLRPVEHRGEGKETRTYSGPSTLDGPVYRLWANGVS